MSSVAPTRVLARATPILELNPIKGADRILLARVMGWNVVVKKDEFRVGDLCIYFSIDSVLEADPEFDVRGGRLKTSKIRGVISQGLAKPLELARKYGIEPATIKEGDDLTRALKVTKYVFCEEGEDNGHGGKGNLPHGMHITEETRVQERHHELGLLAVTARQVVVTRKEDGTSTSYYFHKNSDESTFLVCGHRTVRTSATKESLHYFRMEARFDIERKMRELGRNLIIQGEIVGPGIQANRLQLKELDFRVFYIWDIDHDRKLPWAETVELCQKLGLNMVPVLYQGPFKPEWATVAGLLEWVNSLDYAPGRPAEGVVISTDEPQSSFKVISNRFLLKYGL
jgi:RNA ligase (TIGR02306 family)